MMPDDAIMWGNVPRRLIVLALYSEWIQVRVAATMAYQNLLHGNERAILLLVSTITPSPDMIETTDIKLLSEGTQQD